MKKIIYLVTMLAIAAFTSCEDVPAPYDMPTNRPVEEPEVDENLIMEETFSKNFGSFEVVTVEGTPWVINYGTATGTGYDSKTKVNTASKSYLVSRDIDLSDVNQAYIEFEYIFRYKNNAGEDKVLITDNFKNDPAVTEWEDITGTLTEGNDWETFSKYIHVLDQKYLGKNNIRIALYYSGTDKGSRTWEIKNLKIRKGEPQEDPGPQLPDDLVGDGTQANPYNVASALKVIQAVGSAGTAEEVYVKGKLVNIEPGKDGFPNSFGNVSFYISDDGTESNQLYIYRCFGINGEQITDENYIKKGDDLVLVGKLVNFSNNTPEMTSGGKIFSINGQTGPEPTPLADPTGSGTQDDPFNVSAALGFINNLGSDVQSNEIFVKGTISRIKEVNTGDYGNATYWISDDGSQSNELQVYHGYYLKNEKFTDANAIKVGDEVIVCGKVVNFKGNTPEFVDKLSYLYSINGDTGEPKVAGTHDAPLTIAEAIAFGDAEHAWVKGTIVGVIDATGAAHFDYDDAMSNTALPFLIADGTTKEPSKCLVVQTARLSDIRKSVHPAAQTLGNEVIIYGKLGEYKMGDYNGRGLSNTTYAEVILSTGEKITYGTFPEE